MTTETQQHSPGPYHVDKVHGTKVFDSNGRYLVGCSDMADMPLEEAQANARFIVQACNAQEELLSALRLYLQLDNNLRAGCEITPADWAECHQAAQTAIAKATSPQAR